MFCKIRPTISTLLIFFSLNSFAIESPFKSNRFKESISSANDVASGDLNGDGYIDIFVVSEDYRHQVYFNNSQTIFKPSDQALSTKEGSKVILEDLDNDGDLDAWVGLASYDYDQIYLNDGSGHFDLVNENITNMTEFSTHFIVAADIDNDGDIDVIRTTSDNSRFLYRNNGSGIFTEEVLSINFEHAAMADYDSDGFLDLWTLNGSLTIFLNDKQGHFDDSRTISNNGGSAIGITVADIDNDGDLDVQGYTESYRFDPFSGFPIGSQVSLPRYINNSDGTFISQVVSQFPGSGSSNAGLLIDFDEDLDLDLWAAGIEGRQTNVIATGENGVIDYDNSQSIDMEQERFALTSADFDNDGRLDVLSVGLSGGINLWLNQGALNFEESDQPVLNSYTGAPKGLVATDVNNDGNMDYISANSNGISLYLGNGQLTFEHLLISKGDYLDIASKDFNNDGYLDFVISGRNQTEIWLNNQNNTFNKVDNQDLGGNHYVVDAADYDKDGDQDLLTMEFFGALKIWENDGKANFSLKKTLSSSYLQAKFVDLNNDKKTQLLLAEQDQFTFQVIYRVFDYENSDFIINPDFTISFNSSALGSSFSNLLTFDWEGDGDLDVMTGNRNSSERSILINNGDSGFEVLDIPISSFRFYAIDDFNNDGLVDFLGTGNTIHINNGNNEFTTVEPNIPLDIYEAIVTDFDNDGDLDMVSRSNEGLHNNVNTSIDRDFTGLWFNSEQSGHGLQIEKINVQNNQAIFISWYVYQNGSPVWLSGIGDVIDNTAEIDVIITEGTGFLPDFNSSDVNRVPWGTLTLDFTDKNNLNFSWNTILEDFTSGSMPMQRLTSISEVGIEYSGIRSCHSGSWYNSSQSGHGYMVEVISSAGSQNLILTWYTYLNGEQYWIISQGEIIDNKAILIANSGTGANFPPDFISSDVDLNQWGEITFELIDNTNARISWEPKNSNFPSGQLDVSKLTTIDRYSCD